MATVTPNLNLELPLGTENVSRQLINSNNTKIDTFAGNVQEELDNTAKEVTDSLDIVNVTQGKVVAALGRLVKSGKVARIDGKPSAYKIV